MISHGTACRLGVAGFDGLKYSLVVFHDLDHAAGLWQMKLTDALDMTAAAEHHVIEPEDIGRFEKPPVKGAICLVEKGKIVLARDAALFINQQFKTQQHRTVGCLADKLDSLLLQRATQELRLSGVSNVDQTDACGALGHDLDQPLFTEPDQRIPDGR